MNEGNRIIQVKCTPGAVICGDRIPVFILVVLEIFLYIVRIAQIIVIPDRRISFLVQCGIAVFTEPRFIFQICIGVVLLIDAVYAVDPAAVLVFIKIADKGNVPAAGIFTCNN